MEILCDAYNCPHAVICPSYQQHYLFCFACHWQFNHINQTYRPGISVIILDFCITAILIQALDFHKP